MDLKNNNSASSSENKLALNIDLRYLVLALVLIVIGMLAIWKPWVQTNSNGRTISATGETTIKATPDEYTFSPSFIEEGVDQKAVKNKLSDKTTSVINKLKELGVASENIKLNAYGYDDYYIYKEENSDKYQATAIIEITVNNQEMAQKVQDYLASTDATGQLTPYAQFSESKKKDLETQARQEAINDAKTKAQQSADLLGAKIGKVMTVSENNGFDVYPMMGRDVAVSSSPEKVVSGSAMIVSPGQNEFTYTVSVTFAIK